MHIIVMLVFMPLLISMFFAVTIWLPFQMIMDGIASEMPLFTIAGILLFIFIWGGIISFFAR